MMKMPITYGEYLEWKKEIHPETNIGTWHIEDDCTEYHCNVVLSSSEVRQLRNRLDLKGVTDDKLIDYIIKNKITLPLFPHIFYRDVVRYFNDGSVHFHRTWLDPEKARFDPTDYGEND